MVATVRLDSKLENSLNKLSKTLNKKKSDIIRDAIALYTKNIEDNKKARILNAIEKVKVADKQEFEYFEDTVDDNI